MYCKLELTLDFLKPSTNRYLQQALTSTAPMVYWSFIRHTRMDSGDRIGLVSTSIRCTTYHMKRKGNHTQRYRPALLQSIVNTKSTACVVEVTACLYCQLERPPSTQVRGYCFGKVCVHSAAQRNGYLYWVQAAQDPLVKNTILTRGYLYAVVAVHPYIERRSTTQRRSRQLTAVF